MHPRFLLQANHSRNCRCRKRRSFPFTRVISPHFFCQISRTTFVFPLIYICHKDCAARITITNHGKGKKGMRGSLFHIRQATEISKPALGRIIRRRANHYSLFLLGSGRMVFPRAGSARLGQRSPALSLSCQYMVNRDHWHTCQLFKPHEMRIFAAETIPSARAGHAGPRMVVLILDYRRRHIRILRSGRTLE